jgi:hypothetical protein
MEKVQLGGRAVSRTGISLTGMRTTGMWGEPAGRTAAVAAIRRAVELGAEVLEVPVPFGPAADLLREAAEHHAGVQGAFVVARLTQPLPDLGAVRHRFGGRRPDLIVAADHLLGEMTGWGVPLGALVDRRAQSCPFRPLHAVRGPHPASAPMVEWCEREGFPYMAPSPAILAAGELTIALPAPRSVGEVEGLFGGGPTPPAAGPG